MKMDSDLTQTFARLNIDDGDAFYGFISKYPSSFDLEIDYLPKPKLQTVLNALTSKLDNGFVLVEEEMQVYNLISYLSFKLGKFEDALEFNQKVLKKNKRNGIALANRARFSRIQHSLDEAERGVEQLEQMYSNADADVTTKLIAEGENAQAYARFGPNFFEKAISKYEYLLQNCTRIPRNVVILWKYDYCLCLRRSLNQFDKTDYPEGVPADIARKACKTLSEIIDSTDLQAYTARAWAELGQIVYNIEKNQATFGQRMLEAIPLQKRFQSSQMYFDKALEFGMEDFDTLEVCAKFMRYFGLQEDSVRLFERALDYRKTSQVYHHMALALKFIELKKTNQQRHHNQGRSWQPRYGRGRGRNFPGTPKQREQSNLKRSIKCERNATPLPSNDQTKRILKYLEQAIEKDPFNHQATYDKAFVLRHLGRAQDAKDEFCRLLNMLEIGELKISCYEQAAYCCLDLSETRSGESENFRHDGILFLQKAIQVAGAVAAMVKYSSVEVRPRIPTVKSMLINPGRWETLNHRPFLRLQNLLTENGRLLPVVQEARSYTGYEISELLERYLDDDKADEAALLAILGEVVWDQDESKFPERLTTILKNASTQLANGERETALTMFQIFYRLLGLRIYETNRDFDVFVMADQEVGNLQPMYQVAKWLTDYCGLNVINSDEHCAFGKQILHSLTNFSQTSVAVFIVLKEEKIDYLVEHVVTSIISMQSETPERRPKLVILKDEVVKLPGAWINIPTITLPKPQTNYNNSDISTWLTQLFEAVIKI